MIEEYTLPNTVKEIGDSAFLGSTTLKHVIFNENITSIGIMHLVIVNHYYLFLFQKVLLLLVNMHLFLVKN